MPSLILSPKKAISGRNLGLSDLSYLHKLYSDAYVDATGKSWSFDEFEKRSHTFKFQGTKDGYITYRRQQSGGIKLLFIGINKDNVNSGKASIVKALSQIASSSDSVWSVVFLGLARMLVSKGYFSVQPSRLTELLYFTKFSDEFKYIHGSHTIIPSHVLALGQATLNSKGFIDVRDRELGLLKDKVIIGNVYYIDKTIKELEKLLALYSKKIGQTGSTAIQSTALTKLGDDDFEDIEINQDQKLLLEAYDIAMNWKTNFKSTIKAFQSSSSNAKFLI